MDPLSVTASIIAILQLSAKVLVYLSDVRNAPKDRTHCEIEISNIHSLLCKLRARVETGDPNQPWYTAVGALVDPNGPLDQFKQALEALQSKITSGSRLLKAGGTLMWKFKKEEIACILDRIERLKVLVEIALQMDHFELSQAIKDDTNFIQMHIPVIQSGVDRIQQDQNHVTHSKIVEWISPTDYPAQQSDILRRRQDGTGQWFLDAPQFVSWLSEPKGTLFCPGIPGSGKTMIAAIAVDYLLKSMQFSSVGVAYVYCNYKAQEEQDASSMLSAIVKQLVQARPSSIAEPVKRLHKQHANKGTRPSLDEVVNTLRELLANYSAVYIVVDALDEFRDSNAIRRQFLAKLRELQAAQDVRLMATSRFIPEIEAEFQGATRSEVQANDKDIRRFISSQMYRMPKCVQSDLSLQVMIQDKIGEAVDGMFLLACLHVDSLLDKTTVKKVKTALINLSKGSAALDNAYKDALQRIESQPDGHYELAKKVLSWITYARRPLTTAEICCALAVESEDAKLDPENIPDVEDLITVCAGLVVVDEESAVIRLVHYTMQEYFERIGATWNPSAQLHIASTCLTYLSFDTFKTGSCSSDKELEERLQENKFLDYAAKYWGEHAVKVEGEVCELACSFVSDNRSVSSAEQVVFAWKSWVTGYSQNYPKGSTGLHLAARFGLPLMLKAMLSDQAQNGIITLEKRNSQDQTPLCLAAKKGHHVTVELLIKNGAEINAQGGSYGNALHEASQRGHEATVKLLLDNGADINAQGGDYGNALQAASYRGHEVIVKLLFDNGANVNAQGGRYGNALQAASYGGHEAIVKLLLDNGAVINAQGESYGNALQAASYGGHEAIVKLLLDNGADINAQGGSYGNALQAASYGGHEAPVKLLLDNGADINAQGGYYGNALQAASYGGHEAIVKLLLDNGADINAQGESYGSALQAASYGGHEATVKLLLDNGADINAQGGDYGNALKAASYGRHEAIVKLLLGNGADINAQGGRYGIYSNTLQEASYGGREAIVKLLLDNGADINAQGGYYGNALQAASYRGIDAIVKSLLDNGVNVNTQGGRYGNALQAASYGGHEVIVKLLLDNGANINAQGGSYGNALQAASYGGHEAIMKLLLDNGADINAQGGSYGNALQAASYEGHEVIVKLLIDNGANVNAQGGHYGNALQAASYRGHETTVKLLLDNGANINAQGGDYGNALQAASYRGIEAIVKLLLDNGANVNAQGGSYGKALQAASYRGHEAIVKLLIENSPVPLTKRAKTL